MTQPFTAAIARQLLTAIMSADAPNVTISGHALGRMAQRNVTEAQVRSCVRAGACGEAERERGSWRHPVRAFGWLTVVVVFDAEDSDDVEGTVVVTVIDSRR